MDFSDCKMFYSPEEMFKIILENEIHKDIIKHKHSNTCIARTWGVPGGNHHFIPQMECTKCKKKSVDGYLCTQHINKEQYLKLGIDGGIPTPYCYNRDNTYDNFNSLEPEEKIKYLRSLPNRYNYNDHYNDKS